LLALAVLVTGVTARAANLADIARCCRCAGKLEARGNAFVCLECQSSFENLGPLPALVADREALLRRSRQALADFEVMMQRTGLELQAQLGRFDLLPSTRQRLAHVASANRANRAAITTLFARLGVTADANALERAERQGGGGAHVAQYFEQVLRDWGWGDSAQNQASLARLLGVTGGEQRLGRTLVLGAGPGRLAYDLHRALTPELTIALDIDPFVLLVAHAVLFESGLSLVETPIDPETPAQTALVRQLRRQGEPPQAFALVLADAFEAPFAEASFDTVVTPWFIDVAAEDARDVIALVSHLLRPGGRWLNDGPLLYRSSNFALRYSRQELFELLKLAGFHVDLHTLTDVPYLRSPDSAHARTESVLSFSATKQLSAVVEDVAETPNWVFLPHLPVPSFPRSVPSELPVLARVLSLVDGLRSIVEIAETMEPELEAPPGMTLVDIVGALLLQSYRQSRAS
jgi:hypothetical protein